MAIRLYDVLFGTKMWHDSSECTVKACWSSQSPRGTAMGSESVYLWRDPLKWPEYNRRVHKRPAIHKRAGFPGLEELIIAVANGYLINIHPEILLISPLHFLTLKMWILIYALLIYHTYETWLWSDQGRHAKRPAWAWGLCRISPPCSRSLLWLKLLNLLISHPSSDLCTGSR